MQSSLAPLCRNSCQQALEENPWGAFAKFPSAAPLEAYRHFRRLLCFWKNPHSSPPNLKMGTALRPLFEGVRHLQLLLSNQPTVPLSTEITQPLSYSHLCQLAIYWAMASRLSDDQLLEVGALKLARKILNLGSPPISLWTEEGEFDEAEQAISYYLFLKCMAHLFSDSSLKEKAANTFFSMQDLVQRQQTAVDPFYAAMEEWCISLSPKKREMEYGEEFSDADFFSAGMNSASLSVLFTLKGQGTTMGQILCDDLEIRAMGPHMFPLNASQGFGVKSSDEPPEVLRADKMSCHLKGWTRTMQPEIWTELDLKAEEKEIAIQAKFLGIRPESPMAFSFYVKAPCCYVGEDLKVLPKSLQRYQGISKPIRFVGQNRALTLKSLTSHKMHVIPLAGRGCYWESHFLIAYEIKPFEERGEFQVLPEKLSL